MSHNKHDISNKASVIQIGIMLVVLSVCLSYKHRMAEADRERMERKVDAVLTHFNIEVSDD